MNRSVKALLLSTLLYPGSGHFFLKRHLVGCMFAVLFSVPLLFLLDEIVTKTNQVITQIENGYIPLDIAAITDALTGILSDTEGQTLTLNVYVMSVVWVVSAIDAYRLGK
ncbi:hypothetical protein GCM10007916_12050 [Psychromonas marina]|uniref:Uncharacterized protein n=1 Tax=Psychromonas marina TaxID=88364 RepID=A0ABQ6DYB7_9GAMM|nr:hypothetical protein [Psychromonas marina]GLS90138.1 hypothetical protein GCM10007916_12050 [Psychromonas marina]